MSKDSKVNPGASGGTRTALSFAKLPGAQQDGFEDKGKTQQINF